MVTNRPWTCVVHLRGGVALRIPPVARGDHPRRQRGRPSGSAERRPAGRHDPARGGRRVRRQLRAAGEDRRCVDHRPHRRSRHASCRRPASASSRRTRRCWRGCVRRTATRRCAPPPARTTGTSATSISPPTRTASGDIIQLGDGSSAQNTLRAGSAPHRAAATCTSTAIRCIGQKRGIALNAAHVTIADSYIAECKGVGQDTQAIGGWNGPGPYLDREQLPRSRRRERDVRRRGSGDSRTWSPTASRSAATTCRARWPGGNPIIATPPGVSASRRTGGVAAGRRLRLPRGRAAAGRARPRLARSTASAEVTVTTDAPRAPSACAGRRLPGATEYRVYGRTPGAEAVYWRVTDDRVRRHRRRRARRERSRRPPAPLWSVKNIFELKNARNVVVENNIFENHWKESQPGFAIVLTPRNSQRRLHLVRGRERALRGQHRAQRRRGDQPAGYDVGSPSDPPVDQHRRRAESLHRHDDDARRQRLVPADRRRAARRDDRPQHHRFATATPSSTPTAGAPPIRARSTASR